VTDGLAREGFDRDLRHGEAREDAFVHVLLRSRVEVKSDGQCQRTGNVFIEYKQKGRPSGIATTEAHWYAIEVLTEHWVLVPTDSLKHLTRRAIKENRTKHGGDNDQYLGALVPVEWLVRPLRPA
jgi:hypothetical protein